MRSSTCSRPLVTLLELLGQRWMMRILWELRGGAVLTFRKLQQRCDGVSPAVQNDRLAKLRLAGLVEHATPAGYRLTAAGVSLAHALLQLDGWAQGWRITRRTMTGFAERSAQPRSSARGPGDTRNRSTRRSQQGRRVVELP